MKFIVIFVWRLHAEYQTDRPRPAQEHAYIGDSKDQRDCDPDERVALITEGQCVRDIGNYIVNVEGWMRNVPWHILFVFQRLSKGPLD